MVSRQDTSGSRGQPSHHQSQQQIQDDIDPWTRIQRFFEMPSQTRPKELNISHGWPVMILLPLAGAAKIFHWNPIIVLVVNIVAIIFLSEAISISSDELAAHLGELKGALLSATFGNTVELTAGILALVHDEIPFAQSVMVGSILSDILLVFGCCLVTASYSKEVLEFNNALAKTLSSLMMITAVTMLLPTALYSTFPVSEIDKRVLSFSRGTSLVLLVLYGGYLYFYLGTHKHLFLSNESKTSDDENDSDPSPTNRPSLASSIIRLITAVAATVFCTELLLESINDMAKTLGVSEVFIAIVFIPIASNSTEGVTVITASRTGDTDSAIRVIIDSLLQIGLFVIPFLVVIGWCIAEPMSLFFDSFQTIAMFLAILVVNHLLRDGQYAYIHGAMLLALYSSLVVAFYAH
ncbi:Sodium/calcium exchanger membrane region [Penicillium cf. griseofulvum]|uniref:Vacuolar calcium ion transporter n=1 Tax=Penicillium cf. griseofulvum TaxID=2972120 RepID=A0A9W9MFL9_9EURO|nr:Sodium/calcium exchanger membrane region [Penicillium cf. griseofulvum]KAJ5423555.1 Sodium/calcium exchanger membrane region [Penicillium cf. griseofulvum]